jgi:hypothetical protein
MQARNLKVILVTSALLLTIFGIEALAKEIILFSEEMNWGWIKEMELSDENPYEGNFSLKKEVDAAGWVNHGPHEIPNGNLFEFEDDAGDLAVDEVFIEFYYDVAKADIGYWEVTFQLGGDWANKISKNDLGSELDAEEGYQLFQIPLKDFQPANWWESMPHTITAMQLGASFPQGAVIWLDELRITDELEEDQPVDMLHKLTATWGKIKL